MKKLLDPCCGSGNFLIHAINRYKTVALAAGWSSDSILDGIINHITGFDLNPLAVTTARVNYLIAISDLISTHSAIEIPVFQADAVYAPSLRIDDSGNRRVYKVGTRKTTIDLELPEDLIQQNQLFGRVLEIMERTIRAGDSEAVFVARLNSEPDYASTSAHTSWEPMLQDMFRKVYQLERIPWDRIWCRIVRNYFASVAIGRCRFVASNPPWVRWSELPRRYTERIQDTCKSYGVFSEDRYFGGNELDISGMIVYTVADKWLDSQGGRLSLVLPQMHFQSQSSGGFRQFEVKGIPLQVLQVDDFVQVRPWPDLGNKPTVLTLEKGQRTIYPVKYLQWERTSAATIEEDIDWNTAQRQLKFTQLEANELSGPGHRWIILQPGRFVALQVLDGEDPIIKGRKGIVTDLNGAYFIELLGAGRRPNTVRFHNSPDEGTKPVPSLAGEIELDLVYPLIKGAENIRAFYATSGHFYVIIPNKRINRGDIPTISELANRGYVGTIVLRAELFGGVRPE